MKLEAAPTIPPFKNVARAAEVGQERQRPTTPLANSLLSRRRLIGGGYLGFALFLISLFMNRFRKLGFIEYNGQLKVHNSLLNVILHDAPGLRRDGEDA